MIKTEVILPSPVLQPFVHHYWVLKTAHTGMSHIIMPVGCLRWMFHRKRPFDVDGVTDIHTNAGVVGLYDKAKHITSHEAVDVIMVFFQPYAAKAVMGIPSDEFVGEYVDFEHLELPGFTELKQRVLEAGATDDCIGLIEDFILRQLTKTQGSPYLKRLEQAFRLMNANPEVRIDELASAACLSERQFRRVFAENVGMNPKQILRIWRFHQASNEMLLSCYKDLDTLLNKYGYTDHSHFNREFHEMAGMSPTEYLAFLEGIRKLGEMPAYRSFHASR